MNVVTSKDVDDLLLNIQLAKNMTKKIEELHIVKGHLGYRVRINTGGSWRIVNFRNPKLVANIEFLMGLKVTEEAGVFHASVPGHYLSAKADDRNLAIALAASKAQYQNGELAAAF